MLTQNKGRYNIIKEPFNLNEIKFKQLQNVKPRKRDARKKRKLVNGWLFGGQPFRVLGASRVLILDLQVDIFIGNCSGWFRINNSQFLLLKQVESDRETSKAKLLRELIPPCQVFETFHNITIDNLPQLIQFLGYCYNSTIFQTVCLKKFFSSLCKVVFCNILQMC